MNNRAFRAFGLLFVLVSLGALSCDLADLTGGGKPTVVITSPPSGSQFQEGQEVAVQSTSSDAKGVTRVELVVDGITVRTDPLPSPQPQFALIQTWKATQGTHAITVRAYNASNGQSDPVAISVSVSPSVALGGTPTPTGATTVAGGTPGPGGCSNDAAFVADVTIPSGATVGGGQLFNKIWRVRNAGTCPWGAGYDFTFVGGEAMAATTTIAVPNTDPGITADLLIAMTAPASIGTHSGQWRLRANGVPFGASLTVSISVPPSAPPCPGPPVISSFSASPNPITAGQSTTLSWGGVSNATSAVIDQGVGGVATPGNRSVSPPSTRTYTLTASGCGGVATSQVVVTVNPAPANTATNTVPPPVANFGGHWDTNFGPMDLGQVGNAVTGSYSHYGGGCAGATINGTVTGNTLNGTWGGCGSGSIHFVLAGAGNRWDGNYAGTNKWCAARSGVALAAGCGFSGHWNLRTGGSLETADLTQTGNSVSGTYTKGTVGGTVTNTTLNGTWHIGSLNGPFSWFIASSNLSFQGNYGGTQWCGWRDGQPVIASGANCLQ